MKNLIFIIFGLTFILYACGNEEPKRETSVTQTNPDVYAKFQNIDIQIENNQAHIVGDANASGHKFYYHVKQGDQTVKAEELVKVDKEWGKFEIIVEITAEMKEAEEVVIVHMYTKEEDGTIVNPNYVPLDLDVD